MHERFREYSLFWRGWGVRGEEVSEGFGRLSDRLGFGDFLIPGYRCLKKRFKNFTKTVIMPVIFRETQHK
jgi:hypothetical protein